ncbi:MAG: energy-coupling factor transporter transmembrane component T [Candidatus Lokiarchaeota archaeon]
MSFTPMAYSILPFRFEGEGLNLSKIHPAIRFIIPFIFVIPILLTNDIFLTITIIFLIFCIDLIFRFNILRIFSRIKNIIPFVVIITVFLPFYVGSTILIRFHFIFEIKIYLEGILSATLLFLKILGATFIFLSFFSSLTYSEFIEALTTLRLPSLFVGSLIITLHYIPILARANKKILEAQEMRGKKTTTYWSKLKTHGYIMGKSIVSNMERSEAVYESMKMRGFSGKVTFKPKKVSILDISLLSLALIIVLIFTIFINLQFIYLKVFSLFLL